MAFALTVMKPGTTSDHIHIESKQEDRVYSHLVAFAFAVVKPGTTSDHTPIESITTKRLGVNFKDRQCSRMEHSDRRGLVDRGRKTPRVTVCPHGHGAGPRQEMSARGLSSGDTDGSPSGGLRLNTGQRSIGGRGDKIRWDRLAA